MKNQNNHNDSYASLSLKKIIQNIPRLSELERGQLETLLLAQCSIVKKTAGQVLIEAGQLAGCFYICLEGLLRNYYILENGKIFNKSFVVAPSVAGSLSEYVTGQPSRFSMECMENSTLLLLPFSLLKGVESEPFVEKFYLHIIEGLALVKEKREASLLIDDAKTRLLEFNEKHHHLVDRIPDYHIAAYIGITPVAFSRLKKSLLT
jgi:CRP-like cAMP-binding protein